MITLPLCCAMRGMPRCRAFLAPLHVCEVVIRNPVVDVIEAIYGASPRPALHRTPLHAGFLCLPHFSCFTISRNIVYV